MKALSPGDAAVRLPWLAPRGASLVALSRLLSPPDWSELRTDPGLLLLLLRQTGPDAPAEDLGPGVWDGPGPLDAALGWLAPETPGFVDWNHPAARPVLDAGLTFAGLARLIAERSGRCEAGAAELGGLFVPLGWLAVCGVDPEWVAVCRQDLAFAGQPSETQRAHWGLDAAAIARRLARRWQLPGWLAALAGYPHLSAEAVAGLGPVPVDLVRTVQLAVCLGQRAVGLPVLPPHTDPFELADALGLGPDGLADLERQVDEVRRAAADRDRAAWDDPRRQPLLPDLLRLAAECQRARAAGEVAALEAEADRLQDALARQTATTAAGAQSARLSALAELAAGAGHEINNPLAVISGQGQYLLVGEADPGRQKSLQTIIGQTRRIHDILNGLMQFARPSRPHPEALDAAGLVGSVLDGLRELAGQRQVRLEWSPPAADVLIREGEAPAEPDPLARREPRPPKSGPHSPGVWGDGRQLQAALGHLVRNGIEAAPAGGWLRVRIDATADRVVFVVEDSGPGPAPAQRSHLFDPFFSGRQAGRGRGLGLPTAWRLARLQGGDVRFEPRPAGPTCFTLTVPRCPRPAALPERKSA